MWVAPRAREASSYSRGTARREVSDTEMMEGRIITDSTMIAARRVAPEGRLKATRMAGTSRIMPTRPYTTEGMPASSSTAVWTTLASLGLATLARKMAVIRPMGTPIIMAPAVPANEVKMMARMPKSLVEAYHRVPNRKLMGPISRMAGIPEITR